jgi:uncharacterized membrane protein
MPAPVGDSSVAQLAAAAATAAGHIPDAVWAAIAASGITLFGVYLANKNSRTQLRMQLDASAKESGRQRHFEMRRAVYLDAAEAIARAQNVVGSMGDVDLPNREIATKINSAVETLAKILVVGHPETVKGVANYQAILTEALAALWPKRWELLNRRKLIAVQEKAIAAQLADKERWLEQMKQANVQGRPDPQLFQNLQGQFEVAEKLRLDFTQQLAALNEVQARESLEHFDHGLHQLAKLMQAIPTALARSRAELELPGEEIEFVAILTELKERQQAAVRELAEKVRAAVAATQRKEPPPPPPPPSPQPPRPSP